MKIGKKIRKVRELRDYTQKYMGVQLSICTTAYANIEGDSTDLRWSRICHIAELLSLTPAQLISFDCDKPFASVQELTDSLRTEMADGGVNASRERKLYEAQIELLKGQVEFLRSLHR